MGLRYARSKSTRLDYKPFDLIDEVDEFVDDDGKEMLKVASEKKSSSKSKESFVKRKTLGGSSPHR